MIRVKYAHLQYYILLPNGIILNVNDLQYFHRIVPFQTSSVNTDKVTYRALGLGTLYASGYTVTELRKILVCYYRIAYLE